MEIIIENLKSQRATLVEKYEVAKAQAKQLFKEREELEAEALRGKIDSASEDYMLRMRETIDALNCNLNAYLKCGAAINKISQAVNTLSDKEVFAPFWD